MQPNLERHLLIIFDIFLATDAPRNILLITSLKDFVFHMTNNLLRLTSPQK